MSVSDTHPVRSGARAPFRPNGTISGLCLPGLFLLLTILAPAGLLGQTGAADLIIELEISRPDLERAVSELEGSGDGAADRDRNRRLIELGRTRLERGDFRSGDHVELRVEGEPELTDTFTVAAGPTGPRLSLPMVGPVQLQGVLRSELEPHLYEAVARVIHDPAVRARGLVRVSVLGEVSTPGFYMVTPDALLADALMLAGGPTQEARMDRLRVERSPDSIWHPALVPSGPAEVRTVNELGLQTGDRVIVPPGARFTRRDFITYGLAGLSIFVTALAITR